MNRISVLFWSGMAATLLLAGCEKKVAPVVQLPVVETVTAKRGPMTQYIAAVGEAMPYSSVNLVARVQGYLIKRNFKEGQIVKKGDLLYQIEPEIYEADVKAAEAALLKAHATQRNANIDYERQEKLVKQDATSGRTYDNATARKMEADAEVKAAEAQLAIAKQNLSYTKIHAPFDGWVGLSKFSVGNLVNLNSGSLATIKEISPMRVEFVLNELDLLLLQKFELKKDNSDIKLKLKLQDGTPYQEPGDISFWNNEINPSTGTIRVQAVFENKKGQLLPGMFVRLRLEPPKPRTELLIPQAALMSDQAGDYVYIVMPDGTVARRTIETGFRDDTFVVVNKNLAPGDRVIVAGVQKVRPGAKADAKESTNPEWRIPQATEKTTSVPVSTNAADAKTGEKK